MKDSNCIFCKIIAGKIPSTKVWEDDEFMAIMDINPNMEGLTLVIPKEHYDSDPTDMPEVIYSRLFLATKKVAKMLEVGLDVQRVSIVIEGMGINHVHVKLYPLHGLNEKFTEMWAPNRIYFDKYEGYISTQLGPEKTQDELERVAAKIRMTNI